MQEHEKQAGNMIFLYGLVFVSLLSLIIIIIIVVVVTIISVIIIKLT